MIADRRRPSISTDALFELTRQRIADLRSEAERSRSARGVAASTTEK